MFKIHLKKIAIASGLFLGAFVLSVWAAGSNWTPATCSAPGCNVSAPINVGGSAQNKIGALSIGKGENELPTDGASLEVAGIAMVEGLSVAGDAIVVGKFTTANLKVVQKTETDTLTVGGVDVSKTGHVLTNDGTGKALWMPVGSNDMSTWPKAWYIPDLRSDSANPLPMIKVVNVPINRGPANSSPHDMGGCPPKAVMIAFDKNGDGNVAVLCTAQKIDDLPGQFNWTWKTW